MFCRIFFKKEKNKSRAAEEKLRAHLFVSGKVQAVFYRETTKKKAEKLGVSGWVKNLRDGRVEAIFEGNKLLLFLVILVVGQELNNITSSFFFTWYLFMQIFLRKIYSIY